MKKVKKGKKIIFLYHLECEGRERTAYKVLIQRINKKGSCEIRLDNIKEG
jgi:hypothetical protein